MHSPRIATLFAAIFLIPGVVFGQNDAGAIASAARAVFRQHCYRCHSGAGSEGGEFDVLDPKTMTAAKDGETPLVIPGKPSESELINRAVVKGTMPPKSVKERLSDVEKRALEAWVSSGAPAFASEQRKPITNIDVLRAVRNHLRTSPPENRRYLQYFTLANLHNNPKVPEVDLRGVRASLSKAINSMHWKPRIVVPKTLADGSDTILVIDIRETDWDKGGLWRQVQKAYPYGLRYDSNASDELVSADVEISTLAQIGEGEPLPVMRADWFVSTATRPPLYYTLLEIPDNAVPLETKLGVDIADNFKRDQLMRAGFAASGVSRQNRLLERHDGTYGAFWKSYDFKQGGTRSNLNQFPLGPQSLTGNPFPDQAFEHDGGEIIFSLPNKMQGYMLVDGNDRRIDAGPIQVVGDSLKTSGTAEIVNGLSCMNCHKHGMIQFKDTVRVGSALFGQSRQKVNRLYKPEKEMDERVKEDSDTFMAALGKAVGPFLKVAENKGKTIAELTADEPVAAVARQYKLADLDLTITALELDISDPAELKGMISGNKRLQSLGLAVLTVESGRIKREDWEKARTRSLFQMVASELGKGTPVLVGGR
jgi:serine/threonine-protein kinase